MKKLLITLSFLPLAAIAQDALQTDAVKPTPYKNEIGISTGLAPLFFNRYNGTEMWATARLTYLHNMNSTQIGLILEGGASPWDDGNVFAAGVLNKKFPVGKSYFYAGCNAGFYYADAISKSPFNDVKKTGYTLGIQAGLSLHLSNRFSFFSEIGVQSTQYWFKSYYSFPTYTSSQGHYKPEIIEYVDNSFLISLPGTMGIRYKF